jgi:two-component system response regulator (stage 0 sporulation protein A)
MEKSKLIVLDRMYLEEIVIYLEEKGGEVLFDESHDIKQLLLTIGITSDLKGFIYINDAILCIIENNVEEIGKVYHFVATKHHVSTSSVERSIRYAIDSSEEKGNGNLKRRIFNDSYDIYGNKLSNSKYLFTLANYLAY